MSAVANWVIVTKGWRPRGHLLQEAPQHGHYDGRDVLEGAEHGLHHVRVPGRGEALLVVLDQDRGEARGHAAEHNTLHIFCNIFVC